MSSFVNNHVKKHSAYTFSSFKLALKASKIIYSNIRKTGCGKREMRKVVLSAFRSVDKERKLNPAKKTSSQGQFILR